MILIFLIGLTFPCLAVPPVQPDSGKFKTIKGATKKSGIIDTIHRRSNAIKSLSGLVNIKAQTPKTSKSFKAAIILDSGGDMRIDGLTPFGTPMFHFTHRDNSLLFHIFSSGILYLDYMEDNGLLQFFKFPSTDYNLFELICAYFLSSNATGNVSLYEINKGKEFYMIIKSDNNPKQCKAFLDPSYLPKKVKITDKKGKYFHASYSDYRELDGSLFPFTSVFSIPAQKTKLELSFKSVNTLKKVSAKRFRIPLNPSYTLKNSEDIAKYLE